MPIIAAIWRLLITLCVAGGVVQAFAQAADKHDFSLANTFVVGDESVLLSDYWMSEKYDGVRALWDGDKLTSRGGNTFAVPDWFIAGLPTVQLDGELWLGHGRFEETLSVVRKSKPHAGWKNIRYLVFDAPTHTGVFSERYKTMQQHKAKSNNDYWRVIEQKPIASATVLENYYTAVLAVGGEGLILRRIASYHQGGRSDDYLKYKPFQDAEATVIGYNAGKGKYTDMVGSLQVKTAAGVMFNVGSGLTDLLRQNPPAIGTIITYKYQGITSNGKPRFPVFLRVRKEQE